jgi:hypothetical protein
MNQTVTLTSEEASALILKGEAPDNLRVQGRLSFYDKIPHLPAGLQVDENLYIQRSSLEELPSELKCFELYIDGAALKRLPDDLQVTNKITLKNCVNLEILPSGFKANKLLLDGCHALTTLPPLQIAQEISVNDCTSLEALPSDLKTGRLNLRSCHALKALPEDLDVFFLDIAGCISMSAYPEHGPSTLGSFNMQGCTRLPGLPLWLREVAQLTISDCPAITSWPATLQVRSWVDIANTSLASLPEALKDVQLRWHNVRITKRIAFAPETITPEEIFAEQNIELRRVLIERMGYQTFLAHTHAEVRDADEDPGGPRQLLRVAIPGDEDLVVLSVSCPSTSRRYILRVPPTMQSCHQAAAWIAGFENPDDYQPLIET